MIKLRLKMITSNRLLLLVSILTILSCVTKKKKEPNINLNNNNKEIKYNTTSEVSDHKEQSVEEKIYFNDNISVSFEKNKTGDLGDVGFEKSITVLFVEGEKIFEKMNFSNYSILCDIELIHAKKIQNQLLFGILHICDGEDPDELKIIYWNKSKTIDEFKIPKYFNSDYEKEKMMLNYNSKLSSTNSSINEYVIDVLSSIILER